MEFIHFMLTSESAQQPSKAKVGDAGFDLFVSENVKVEPGEVVDVPTNLHIELPTTVWAMITGRSSTIRKRGLLCTTGIIDSGYRGELFFAVLNTTDKTAEIKVGERLAQLLLFEHVSTKWLPASRLSNSDRGHDGFGSSGT